MILSDVMVSIELYVDQNTFDCYIVDLQFSCEFDSSERQLRLGGFFLQVKDFLQVKAFFSY